MPQATQENTSKVSNFTAATRVRVIGLIITILGILGAIVFLSSIALGESTEPGEDWFYFVVYTLTALLGYGIIHRKKIALKIFEIISIFNVIGGAIILFGSLVMLPFMFSIAASMAMSSVMGFLLFIGLLLSLASPVLSLIALILLHPKQVQELFS